MKAVPAYYFRTERLIYSNNEIKALFGIAVQSMIARQQKHDFHAFIAAQPAVHHNKNGQ